MLPDKARANPCCAPGHERAMPSGIDPYGTAVWRVVRYRPARESRLIRFDAWRQRVASATGAGPSAVGVGIGDVTTTH